MTTDRTALLVLCHFYVCMMVVFRAMVWSYDKLPIESNPTVGVLLDLPAHMIPCQVSLREYSLTCSRAVTRRLHLN